MADTKNVYDMVTNRIMEDLAKGTIPWRKSWVSVNNFAYNRVSKKKYSLLNQLLLGRDGEWATYKQWESLGGKVRKCERSSFVVFWKMFPKPTGKFDENGDEIMKYIPMLRYYNVFHVSQVDGVEAKEIELNTTIESIDDADAILKDYVDREGIKLVNEELSNNAYYAPLLDEIHIPMKEQYKEIADYYATAFHEAVHSTGAENRCNRPLEAFYRDKEAYSKEELVAEIGSAMILNALGIDTDATMQNTSAYCEAWLKRLRDDNKLIVTASSKAEKAMEYILGTEEEVMEETA